MFSDLIFDYLSKSNTESGVDNSFQSIELSQGIKKDSYEIKTEEESVLYGKPKGRYELISIPDVLDFDKRDINYCIKELSKSLQEILGKITSNDRVLVVGLGNRHISSDSLGAKVVGGINVTIECKTLPKVMAISPSVMGLTGIETVQIIEGVVSKVKPSHVILIDSLCASGVERLGKSIQITNTGICPGGGIGNKRKCIGEDIAKNVYSIGVPLLIYASTFVRETLNKNNIDFDVIRSIMQSSKNKSKNSEIFTIISSLKNILSDDVDNMIVSIKDIEECVKILSHIISSAINIALGVDE